jgi:hypothetical protein
MFTKLFVQLTILFTATALTSVNGFLTVARAQAVAEPTASAPAATAPTARQQAWLNASINERVLLAEDLGEEGGRVFAKAKGWTTVYDGTSWSLVHGPDQVYRAADDTIHMIEAKGGSSQLGKGYGHPQGSSEWAVESAKRVLGSATATEAERLGARAVIEAAANGTLEVHVVRTTHTLGEPHVAKLEQTTKCSEQASKAARETLAVAAKSANKALNEVAKASDDAAGAAADVARLGDDVTRFGDDLARSADDVARATSRSSGLVAGAPAVLGPAGIAIDAGMRVVDGIETERRYEMGEISGQERTVAHGRNVAGMAGGIAGAYYGAEAGTASGAAIGTFFCPGIGTAIGGFIGGLAGGIGGYFAGDAVASASAQAAIEATATD